MISFMNTLLILYEIYVSIYANTKNAFKFHRCFLFRYHRTWKHKPHQLNTVLIVYQTIQLLSSFKKMTG